MSKDPVILIESEGGSNEGAEHISKKLKQKRRHDNWLRKINTAQVQKEQSKKHTPAVVGDLQPLKQALSELADVTDKEKDKQKKVRQLSSKGGQTSTRKGRQHVL
jgi:hypothetical protein